jgi:hypothetical protein
LLFVRSLIQKAMQQHPSFAGCAASSFYSLVIPPFYSKRSG